MRRWGRYLLAEILPLYFAGLALLLLLLLGGFLLELLADALSRGVPAGLIARYLLYKLPAAAIYGIPLALLFAALQIGRASCRERVDATAADRTEAYKDARPRRTRGV